MPTFNRAGYVTQSIESVRQQMRADDSLLVLDDGSTDGTEAAIAPIVKADPRIGYQRQDNAGKSVALNRAIAATSGDLVWICDDDDLLRPDAVATLLDRQGRDESAFTFGRYTRFRDTPDGVRVDLGTGYWPDLAAGGLARHLLEDLFIFHNATVVPRRLYQLIGPFSETLPRSVDYEMFLRLALSFPCRFVDHLIFDQRQHEGARGPVTARHAASASATMWRACDRRIFENMRDHVPTGFFESLFDAPDPHQRQRAALLQRACIGARRACWVEAAADFAAAATLVPTLPLDPGEAAICRRALAGKFGLADSADDAVAALAPLRASARGREILIAMIDGALWRLHGYEPGDDRAIRRLMRRLLGPVGLARLGLGRLGGGGTARVVERPEPAYLAPGTLPAVSANA